MGWEIDPEPSFTPRGNSSCFSKSILIMHMFRRIQIPENCRCRYPISVCNEPGNESIPRSFSDHLTCFCDHLAETWFCRGGPGVWPPHAASTYIEGTCETLSWSSHRPHVCLRVSSATASLCSGKILVRILTRIAHIHPTRREGGIFAQSATTRVDSTGQLLGWGNYRVSATITCIERLIPYLHYALDDITVTDVLFRRCLRKVQAATRRGRGRFSLPR